MAHNANQPPGQKPVAPAERKAREECTACDQCGERHRSEDIVWVGSARAWLCEACRAEAETCGCSD